MDSRPTPEVPPSPAAEDPLQILSHDLKTPLTSLQMAIYLLIEDAAPRLLPKELELLMTAREDVTRIMNLIVERLDKPQPPRAG